MPTFIIKSIPNWKDAPQRVNNFALELNDANGETRSVEFTRGWLQRFRPMTLGYITFRGSNTPWWVPSMAVYSPTGPDVLSVWPVEADRAEQAALETDDMRVIVVHPTPTLSGTVPELAPGARLIEPHVVELEPAVIIHPSPDTAVVTVAIDAAGDVFTKAVKYHDEVSINQAIKAANRPLSKVPSVLAKPISKEIDVLARAGELGKGYAPDPADTTTQDELRAECAALKTNLDNCAKARDLAEINLTGARGQYQTAQAQVTTLTERINGATERANRTEQRHGALVEKHAALEAEFDTQRETIRKLQNDGREQYDRINAQAVAIEQARERLANAERNMLRAEDGQNGARQEIKAMKAAHEQRAWDLEKAVICNRELSDQINEQAKTIEQLREELEAANMRADEKELELDDFKANYKEYDKGGDATTNDGAGSNIRRHELIERLKVSRALGLEESELTTLSTASLEQLAGWEENEQLRKLTEYGQTFRFFGGAQHAETPTPEGMVRVPPGTDLGGIRAGMNVFLKPAESEEPDLNTLLDNSPDRIKAREQARRKWPEPLTFKSFGPIVHNNPTDAFADAVKFGTGAYKLDVPCSQDCAVCATRKPREVPTPLNPVHDFSGITDEKMAPDGLRKLESLVHTMIGSIEELADIQREQDDEFTARLGKLEKRGKKLRRQLRDAGVL